MDTTTNTSINSTATFSFSHSKQPVNNRSSRRSWSETLQEMPIASGAAGRVDVGVDTSTTWTPDGLKKKTKPANRNYDSYLQRYQEQRKKNKSNLLQDNTDVTDQENDGTKEGNPEENCGSEDLTAGIPSSGERSKKSLLCVVL